MTIRERTTGFVGTLEFYTLICVCVTLVFVIGVSTLLDHITITPTMRMVVLGLALFTVCSFAAVRCYVHYAFPLNEVDDDC